MTKTKITLTVAAVSLTTAALLGSLKFASAHSNMHNWQGGIVNKIHALSDDDWSDQEKMQQIQQMCLDSSVEKLDTFIDHIKLELDLDQEQSQSWNTLVSSLQEEKTTIAFFCEKLLTRENVKNLPARLELLSSMMVTGQELLQRISPAINQFYLALNDDQKEQIESMITRHHQRRGMFNH